jgi:hypothetical protein
VSGHKYKIGQLVDYLGRERASGVYQITQLMPPEGGVALAETGAPMSLPPMRGLAPNNPGRFVFQRGERMRVRRSSASDRTDQPPDSTWRQMSQRGVIVIFDVRAERRQYERSTRRAGRGAPR